MPAAAAGGEAAVAFIEIVAVAVGTPEGLAQLRELLVA